MSAIPKCTAAARLRGEFISCEELSGHTGKPHRNRDHDLIWVGDEHGWIFFEPYEAQLEPS